MKRTKSECKKVLHVDDEQEDFVYCEECRGFGRVYDPLNVTDDGFMSCWRCNGDGIYQVTTNEAQP